LTGERRAREFLQKKGFEFLDQNVRSGNSEVDLIFWDHQMDEVVFVEVKTRASERFGHGSGAVGYRKLRGAQVVARAYLAKRHLKKAYRFDIICVVGGKVEHFENVTWSF
jgi:putative endonuclease